jgi:hypothetical protein
MVRLVLTVLLAALGTACAGACRVQLYVAAGGKLADRAPVAGQVAKVLVDANTQVKGGTQRVVQDEPCHDLDPISDIMTYIAPLLTGRVARDRRQPPHRHRLSIAARLLADGAHVMLHSWTPHDAEQSWGADRPS